MSYATGCEEQDIYCSIPGGSKVIEGIEVHRDCWQYKYKMNCNRITKNDCKKIDVNICNFVGEECLHQEKEGDLSYCGNLKRKYACERQIEWEEEKIELIKDGEVVDGKDLLCASLCLDGNCDAVKKAPMEKDNDLSKAAAMLTALKDAKKGIVGDALVNVFKGSAEHCDKKFANYTNCCKLKSWGGAVGASCSPETKNLAKKRREKKCINLGTYCASKKAGICGRKRTTFCCYDSIIARIINQEAKRQLGRNNGTAENPECGGLNIEDLEKVDLSKADFKDFYDDIVIPNINIPDVKIDATANAKNTEDITKSASNLPIERKGFSEKTLKEGVQ